MRILESYGRTVNACETAREVGRTESSVRFVIGQAKITRIRERHARECEKALRKSRGRLGASEAIAARLLSSEGTEGPGMEPKDIAALMNAQAKLSGTLVTVADHTARTRQARLTREKTRLECEFLRKRMDGKLPADKHEHSFAGVPTDELEKEALELARKLGHTPG